ncbi:MAG TPA: phosphatase PAP2 family protein [Thermoleophilia bacterium]|nr:phosphatase PAP2 family protein [Thermoleophilia bacterium]
MVVSKEGTTGDDGARRPAGAPDTAASRSRLRHIALLAALLGVLAILFAALAAHVAERGVLAWDDDILRYVADRRTASLTGVMEVVTDLGATVTLATLAIVLGALLLRKGLRREAFFLLLSTGSAAALNALLKQLFQRPRPDVVAQVVPAHGFAFPSGHTMSSMALACAVTFVCWRLRWRYRWPVSLAALTLAVAIGASRVYLGVHYPSDVLAGWMASIILVVVINLLLFEAHPPRLVPASEPTPTARPGPATARGELTTTAGGDRGDEA